MEIKSLADTPFDELYEAFASAFSEYEVQPDREQLREMLRRRGFCAEWSFAAFDNGQIVSFVCNGIGTFGGVQTAYDTGTGTLKSLRGQGLATRILEYAFPRLSAAGIGQYLLEVLQHNAPAVAVYRRLGFEVSREFNYFGAENAEIENHVPTNTFYRIRPITLMQAERLATFGDFAHSWQNNFASIARAEESFEIFGAFAGDTPVGYGIFDPATGDIAQLAVAREHRRKGVGSLLLAEMLAANRYSSVKALNTEVGNDAVTTFFTSKNIALRGRQFEMIRKL